MGRLEAPRHIAMMTADDHAGPGSRVVDLEAAAAGGSAEPGGQFAVAGEDLQFATAAGFGQEATQQGPNLAVGAAPDGTEAWAHAGALAHGVTVGAPPDPFSVQGQNWGLPAPNPLAEALKAEMRTKLPGMTSASGETGGAAATAATAATAA